MQLAIGAALMAASMAAPAAFAQARTRTVISSNTPYLGIGCKDVDSDSAKKLNLKEVRGVEITQVEENSPAAKAGIKEGDVVLEYNGEKVEGGAQLSRLVHETPVGRQVKLGVWRNGSMQTLAATAEERKGPVIVNSAGTWAMPDLHSLEEMRNFRMPDFDMPNFSMTYNSPRLGIMGEPLGSQEQLAEFFGVKDGVLVKSVTRNSAAEKAGIKAGDVIVKIDDEKVNTSSDITRALRGSSQSKKTVTVVVVRQKKETPITVTVETPAGVGRPVRALVGPVYFNWGGWGDWTQWVPPMVVQKNGTTIVFR
jgi:serine protease Do